MKRFQRTFAALSLVVVLGMSAEALGQELVVYSARIESLIKPVFDLYTAETGVRVMYLTDQEPVLLQRIKAEGDNTAADLLLTVDAGNLWHAANEGVLHPVDSEVLTKNIPEHLRDPDKRWFGLSVRARTLVYSTRRVKPGDLSTYEELADPKWKGRLALRSSKKVYNQSLVAMLIKEHGEAKAAEIVGGWVRNLATQPFADDTKTMEAVVAGIADVAVVNTYYFGRLVKKDPAIPLAVFWPNQSSSGVHVNVSGAGIVAASKNKKAAVAFLEWLSTDKAQKIFAEVNLEYPANPSVPVDPIVAAWGTFNQNRINVSNTGEYQVAAIQLMDRMGYK